jgi:hypothetical protein
VEAARKKLLQNADHDEREDARQEKAHQGRGKFRKQTLAEIQPIIDNMKLLLVHSDEGDGLTAEGVSKRSLMHIKRAYLHWCKATVGMSWRHAHRRVDGWRRGWTIRCAGGTRIVLTTPPREANTRVADRISLHLVDGHLRGVALNKLYKTTPFARRNLDICDLPKALEE